MFIAFLSEGSLNISVIFYLSSSSVYGISTMIGSPNKSTMKYAFAWFPNIRNCSSPISCEFCPPAPKFYYPCAAPVIYPNCSPPNYAPGIPPTYPLSYPPGKYGIPYPPVCGAFNYLYPC